MPPTPVYCPRLRCEHCGRVVEVTADELTRLSRGKLPECCSRALTLEVDGLFVRPAERTKLERGDRRAA
jgi:hypothetical protein